MARVAIVVPARNAEATIGETLDSVAHQTFADFETVVVDDGSTDRTAEIAASFDARFRCLREAPRGVSAARNRGVELTSAPFIAFLDADDYWDPTKLERQLEALSIRPEAGVCYAAVTRVGPRGDVVGSAPALEYDDPTAALLLYSNIVSGSCSSAMVRRDSVRAVRFDPRFSQCADWHYWLRLSLDTGFVAVPQPLVMYRSSGENMSSDIGLLERDTFAVLDAFYAEEAGADPYRSIRQHVYSNHWMILSGSYLHAGRLADSVRCLARGLALWPANITKPLTLPVRRARRAAS